MLAMRLVTQDAWCGWQAPQARTLLHAASSPVNDAVGQLHALPRLDLLSLPQHKSFCASCQHASKHSKCAELMN